MNPYLAPRTKGLSSWGAPTETEQHMELERLADAFGYAHDGQHIVLPFGLSPPGGAARHPVGGGGKLAVSPTGYVAGMILDTYDDSAFGTMASERLAVWSMNDDELERLARVAADALAMRRAFVAARAA